MREIAIFIRIPLPDSIAIPVEVQIRHASLWGGWVTAALTTVLGLAFAGQRAPAVVTVSAVIVVCALAVGLEVAGPTA